MAYVYFYAPKTEGNEQILLCRQVHCNLLTTDSQTDFLNVKDSVHRLRVISHNPSYNTVLVYIVLLSVLWYIA